MDKFIKVHNLMWLFYFFLFSVGPFEYIVKAEIYFIIFFLILTGNVAYFLGKNSVRNLSLTLSNRRNCEINISKTVNFYFILSAVYFILFFIKSKSNFSHYNLDFSLESSIKMREEMGYEGFIQGDNIYGVLSSIVSGFPMLLIPFYLKYNSQLNKKRKRIIFTILLLFIISLFVSGGRNGAFITIMVFYFSFLLTNRIGIRKNNLFSSKQKKYLISLLILIGFIFGKIAISRTALTGALNDYVDYIVYSSENNLRNYASVLLHSDRYASFYFPFFQFHDYFVHSFSEFQITLNNSPKNFPYFGAYNLHTFALFFNKIGFDIISIQDILHEIPNPGRYLTLFGALYLDFGLFGMFIAVFILYLLVGRSFKKVLLRKHFTDFYWFIYLYLIIFLAPIYSIIGTSVYPGFLVACIVSSVILKIPFFQKYTSNYSCEN